MTFSEAHLRRNQHERISRRINKSRSTVKFPILFRSVLLDGVTLNKLINVKKMCNDPPFARLVAFFQRIQTTDRHPSNLNKQTRNTGSIWAGCAVLRHSPVSGASAPRGVAPSAPPQGAGDRWGRIALPLWRRGRRPRVDARLRPRWADFLWLLRDHRVNYLPCIYFSCVESRYLTCGMFF